MQITSACGRLPRAGGNAFCCLPLTFKMGRSDASSQDGTGPESGDAASDIKPFRGTFRHQDLDLGVETALGRQNADRHPGCPSKWCLQLLQGAKRRNAHVGEQELCQEERSRCSLPPSPPQEGSPRFYGEENDICLGALGASPELAGCLQYRAGKLAISL